MLSEQVAMTTPDLPSRPADDPLPKLCGADMELGNFIHGLELPTGNVGSGYAASRALLAEIRGIPNLQTTWPSYQGDGSGGGQYLDLNNAGQYQGSASSQDWGRKFLANGACFYIDLCHLEACVGESLSAYDHVAGCHALFRQTQEAMRRVNARLTDGLTVKVLANNSDGQSNSYGTHLNFLLTRRAWNNIFHFKLHHLLFLASYQASSIVFTGQGKVGAENGAPAVRYQISQRADFFETLSALQTTFSRPIINSRDEPICGDHQTLHERTASAHLARYHCIFYDNNLCHVSALLKVGVLQIILAMLERERVPVQWLLEDPVRTVIGWSHDPTLQATAPLIKGSRCTAVEMQLEICAAAAAFVAEGGCDGLVPHAREILALWQDTLELLRKRDFNALSSRLDWVLKWRLLQQATQGRNLAWDSAQIRHLDQIYASLDPDEGLFWKIERSGAVQRCVTEEHIRQRMAAPPEDTRAWTRGELLQRFPEEIEEVDWDYLRFRHDDGRWPALRHLHLADPLKYTKQATDGLWSGGDLDDILDALGAPRPDVFTFGQSTWSSSTPSTAQRPMSAAAPPSARTNPRGNHPPRT
jgi:Pup amidohydrolase